MLAGCMRRVMTDHRNMAAQLDRLEALVHNLHDKVDALFPARDPADD